MASVYLIIFPLLFLCAIPWCQARYIDQGGKYSVIRLLASAPKSDPDLKEGVIAWVKEQLDAELLKNWYDLNVIERLCVQSAVTQMYPVQGGARGLPAKMPQEVVEFINETCPSVRDQAEQLYENLRQVALKIQEWHDNFMEDLPESIRTPIDKIRSLSKDAKKSMTEAEVRAKGYELFSAIEEILNAPEEDREVLAGKHDFLAPFVTGNLRDDTLKVAQAMKKTCINANPENEAEAMEALKRLLNDIKTDLLSYFKSRTHAKTSLPKNVDRDLSTELSFVYDIAYAAGAQVFADLVGIEN